MIPNHGGFVWHSAQQKLTLTGGHVIFWVMGGYQCLRLCCLNLYGKEVSGWIGGDNSYPVMEGYYKHGSIYYAFQNKHYANGRTAYPIYVFSNLPPWKLHYYLGSNPSALVEVSARPLPTVQSAFLFCLLLPIPLLRTISWKFGNQIVIQNGQVGWFLQKGACVW